jgi:hypothetical protein
MAATYTPIASITLGADASSVTFSSIPQTYTDLILVSKTSLNGSAVRSLALRFNSDSSTNYSLTRMYADGSSTASDRDSNINYMGVGIVGFSAIASAGTFINNIMNYANTTTNKTVVSRSSDTAGTYISMYIGLWRSTSAITSVTILPSNDSLRSGSTFNLYGIQAGNA